VAGGWLSCWSALLNEVLEAEIVDHLRAEPHERTDGRRGWRNGHYERSLTTRVGTLELRVPRDRDGTFRTDLFQRYHRSEKALVLALMEMVANGVSMRKVRRITDELCGWEILGVRIANSETEQGWLETFRWLKSRGLEGVDLMVSDAHEGLVEALHRCFQGTSWQRCQAHFRLNVLDKTPVVRKQAMAKGMDRVLEADTPGEPRRAFQGLADRLEGDADRALETLETGLGDTIAVLRLPDKYRRRLRTTNALERLIQEVRRREKVIRIFPNEASAHRLLGAYLAETHEEWTTGRRYFTMGDYFAWRAERDGRPITEAAA